MKKKYTTPLLTCTIVYIEDSLSVSSISFTTGGNGDEPTVNDWDQEIIINDLEF